MTRARINITRKVLLSFPGKGMTTKIHLLKGQLCDPVFSFRTIHKLSGSPISEMSFSGRIINYINYCYGRLHTNNIL